MEHGGRGLPLKAPAYLAGDAITANERSLFATPRAARPPALGLRSGSTQLRCHVPVPRDSKALCTFSKPGSEPPRRAGVEATSNMSTASICQASSSHSESSSGPEASVFHDGALCCTP